MGYSEKMDACPVLGKGKNVRRFNNWQKTKVDELAPLFSLDTVPGIFS
jgi:hypothetical protein